MFDWFRKNIENINDPVFGEMGFAKSYWEGCCIFPPIEKEIEIFADGNEEGVFDTQHAIYRKIVESYASLKDQISPLLIEEGESWEKESIDNAEETFNLTAISISGSELNSMECVFMFESNLTGTPTFDVQVKNWHTTGTVEISR
ncbi:hypothetical protein SAMN02745866_03202 [Alteromonadaceae bacterium Bs31]|nr:hypothetical protein SAMN02745866_03202 [Alteromonadaceae bacterium Bs31]